MSTTWRVPMVCPNVGEEEAQAVAEVVRSGWLATGPKVPAIEAEMAKATGCDEAVAFCNGTAALHAILKALGIGPGDEVIVPAITFVSSATCVLHAGATVVFADVCRDTLNLDVEDVRQALSSRTKAIIAVHYGGQATDMDELCALAAERSIPVVEDAAAAHGALYRGRPVGGLGTAAMFSFTPSKNVTSGEGGIVTTKDGALADRLRLLRNHGSRALYQYELVGYNYRMTEMQAALGLVQLERLEAILARKREICAALTASIQEHACLSPPHVCDDRTHTHQLYTLQVKDAEGRTQRDQILASLREQGVQARICFSLLPGQAIFAGHERARICPSAAWLDERIISLPIHSCLTGDDLNTMAQALDHALGD